VIDTTGRRRLERASRKGRRGGARSTRAPGRIRVGRLGGLALLAGAGAIVLSSCLGSASTIQGESATPLLSSSPAHHTVYLELLAGAPSGTSTFNFDGAEGGRMTVTVPLGWTVEVTCINYSTKLTNSCAIVRGAALAFKGAESARAHRGLLPSKSSVFSFVANKAGDDEIVSLVPGHRALGQWDHFDVQPSVKPRIVGAHRVPQGV